MEKMLFGLLFLSECLVLSTCLVRHYHFVGQNLTWTEAQKYCREKHTDLATMQNSEEQNQLRNTLSSAGSSSDVWIGLRHEVDWKWSDGFSGTGADYRDWMSGEPNFYDTPGVKKTVVKVKVKVDGSVDLKDPAVQEQLLKQLQDKLKEDGVDGVTLKWKKQKDGEVFHKEDEL
ncbi:snaclec 7-like [Cololabis saira]|uniref:snaclec 7-like n=1 Tax=Cololabis saira TaxID=129043 RepID=UPI002AD4CDF3|nr:snaclec 7-like [Cololabis saira]